MPRTPAARLSQVAPLVLVLSAGGGLVACQVRQSSGALALSATASSAAPALGCAVGELQSFGLAAIDPMPTFDLGVLKGNPAFDIPDVPVKKVRPEGVMNLRLDVCVAPDDSATLRQVIFVNGGFGSTNETLILQDPGGTPAPGELGPSAYKVAGLSQAIFGDVKSLNIELNTDWTHLAVRAAPDGAAVIAGRLFQNGAAPGLVTDQYLVGKLTAGDPFPNTGCATGVTPTVYALRLGTAAFKFTGCEVAVQTSGFPIVQYNKAEVTDTSAKLPPALRGKTFTLDKTAIVQAANATQPLPASGDFLAYTQHHHNSCDGFVLRLPHATYGATSTGPAADFGGICKPMVVLPGMPAWATKPAGAPADETAFTVFEAGYGGAAPARTVAKGCYYYTCGTAIQPF